MDLKEIETKIFIEAIEYVSEHGDPISQLGAVEIGIGQLASRPELYSALSKAIYFTGDNLANNQKNLELFILIFALVDERLASLRILFGTPPFYRRMAALAHAGLIYQTVGGGKNQENFSDWILGASMHEFALQILVDMRTEPRWRPADANVINFKNQFQSRILNALGAACISNGTRLYKFVIESLPKEEMPSIGGCYFNCLSPLDGGTHKRFDLPTEVSQLIEETLSVEGKELIPESFIFLINISALGMVDTAHIELAIRRLRESGHHFSHISGRDQLLSILNGLAYVAAVSRSLNLAGELKILIRRYRYDEQYKLTIKEIFPLYLMSSSAESDLIRWCEFLGDCLNELAFGPLSKDDTAFLFPNVRALLNAAPELWLYCSPADAALRAHRDTL